MVQVATPAPTTELAWHIHEHTIPSALSLLPGKMDSLAARAMLLAIGLQESRFVHRIQVPNGPAHGFWQFERGGGVAGVLTHPATQPIIHPILDLLCYPATAADCYAAIVHNDVLACVFARLLLWTDPRVLPPASASEKGLAIYLATWRPGKPHPQTWPQNFAEGWRIVSEHDHP